MRISSVSFLRWLFIASLSLHVLAGCSPPSVLCDGVFKDVVAVRNYLSSGGSPDLISKNDSYKSKRTLLHNAAAYSDPDIVRALLDGGANPNLRDGGESTPLILAVSLRDEDRGRVDIIQMLIPITDLSVKDDFGMTAFDYALKYRSPEVIAVFKKLEDR